MKRLFQILILFFTSHLTFGQIPTEKVGGIEVQIIGHSHLRNSEYKLTKKVTNRKNRPYFKMYFDISGTLLKTIGYGKHHNRDLRLLDEIHTYSYDSNGIKSRVEVWETDYKKNLSHKHYKTFELDSTKSNILSENTYTAATDSIMFTTDYWFNEKGQYQGVFIDSTYYYTQEYDSQNRLIRLQQIYESKLRWEWNYTYSDTKREGVFQTYYSDGKDYSKKEIQTFDNEGLLTETEEFYDSKDGLNEKTKLYYDKQGIVSKIDCYDKYNKEDGYELISYIVIKTKSKTKIDAKIAKRINEEIIN